MIISNYSAKIFANLLLTANSLVTCLKVLQNDPIRISSLVKNSTFRPEIAPGSFLKIDQPASDFSVQVVNSLDPTYGWIRANVSNQYWPVMSAGEITTLDRFSDSRQLRLHVRASVIVALVESGQRSLVFNSTFTVKIFETATPSNAIPNLDITVIFDLGNKDLWPSFIGPTFGDTFFDVGCNLEGYYLKGLSFPDLNSYGSITFPGIMMTCRDRINTEVTDIIVGDRSLDYWYYDYCQYSISGIQLSIPSNAGLVADYKPTCYLGKPTIGWLWNSDKAADLASCPPLHMTKGIKAYYDSKSQVLTSLALTCSKVQFQVSVQPIQLDILYEEPYFYLDTSILTAILDYADVLSLAIQVSVKGQSFMALQVQLGSVADGYSDPTWKVVASTQSVQYKTIANQLLMVKATLKSMATSGLVNITATSNSPLGHGIISTSAQITLNFIGFPSMATSDYQPTVTKSFLGVGDSSTGAANIGKYLPNMKKIGLGLCDLHQSKSRVNCWSCCRGFHCLSYCRLYILPVPQILQ